MNVKSIVNLNEKQKKESIGKDRGQYQACKIFLSRKRKFFAGFVYQIYTISQTDGEDRLGCMAHGVMSVTIYTCSGGRDWLGIGAVSLIRARLGVMPPLAGQSRPLLPLFPTSSSLFPSWRSYARSNRSVQVWILLDAETHHYGTSQSQSTIYSPACVSRNGSNISTDEVGFAMELTRVKCFKCLVYV